MRELSPSGGAGVLLEELDGVADGQDVLGRVIGDLAAELLLEGHHELDRVQTVGAQVVDEAGVLGDLVGLHAQMLHDNLLHALSDIAHRLPSCRLLIAISSSILLGSSLVRSLLSIRTADLRPAGTDTTRLSKRFAPRAAAKHEAQASVFGNARGRKTVRLVNTLTLPWPAPASACPVRQNAPENASKKGPPGA